MHKWSHLCQSGLTPIHNELCHFYSPLLHLNLIVLSTFPVSFQGRYWPKVFFPEDEWSTWSHECSQGALLGRSLQKTMFNLQLNLVQSGAFWSPPKRTLFDKTCGGTYMSFARNERERVSLKRDLHFSLKISEIAEKWSVTPSVFRILIHPSITQSSSSPPGHTAESRSSSSCNPYSRRGRKPLASR